MEKVNSPNYLFTADTHFDHANIIKYCKRPFSSVSEMNETIISNWNEKVQPGDIVYHGGDFGFSREPNRWKEILRRLNGQIYLVKGNHDSSGMLKQLRGCFADVRDYYKIKVPDEDVKGGKRTVILMHYALRVWDKSHYGSFHLYGHSHGTLLDDKNMRSIDVGVDCHNFYPLTYSEVKAIMLKKNWKPIDHHGRKE